MEAATSVGGNTIGLFNKGSIYIYKFSITYEDLGAEQLQQILCIYKYDILYIKLA